MRCPKCGRENGNNNRYCIYCGQKLEINREIPNKKSWALELVLILSIILIMCGSFMAYKSYKKADIKNDSALSAENDSDLIKEADDIEPDIASQESTSTEIPESADIHSKAVTFQGHSYYIFENNCNTWEEAEKYCESRGGYLAVINDKEEDNFLFEHMLITGRTEVYFGLSDIETEGIWKWVGGRESTYLNWGINDEGDHEPNKDSKKERYVEYDASLLQGSGTWNDCEFGRDTTAYICEWDYAR